MGDFNYEKRFKRIRGCMKERCNNPNHSGYKNYGAKGIKVEWDNYLDFRNDMYDSYCAHEEKYGLNNSSIDRIDSNKNYNKENCRRATMLEQNNNSSSNHPIDYNGVHYNTISGLCRAYGVNYPLVRDRIRNGWDINRAINTPANGYVNKIEYQGKIYRSLGALCRELGIVDVGIARDRIKKGRNIEDAVTTPQLRQCTHKKNIYKGIEYPSIEALCREVKPLVAACDIRKRISNGMSIEEAVDTPPRSTKIIYRGIEYPSLAELCLEKGVKYKMVQQRIHKLGRTVEDAIEIPQIKYK